MKNSKSVIIMTTPTSLMTERRNQNMADKPILQIRDLIVDYPTKRGYVRAVDQLSLTLNKGEVLGLVGESGCGKSTLGFAILGLLKGGYIRSGEILFEDTDLAR
ncbi:MAG: ATP-binding cassette domain-containing protein, partial [Candidatus Hodarchaeota archaeon]